jgi:hypothetical protein
LHLLLPAFDDLTWLILPKESISGGEFDQEEYRGLAEEYKEAAEQAEEV